MAPPSPRERRTRFVASQAPGSSLPPSLAPLAGMVESDGATGFARLWTAFMSARILIGLAILGLHLSLHLLGRPTSGWLLAWCRPKIARPLRIRADMKAVPRRATPVPPPASPIPATWAMDGGREDPGACAATTPVRRSRGPPSAANGSSAISSTAGSHRLHAMASHTSASGASRPRLSHRNTDESSVFTPTACSASMTRR